MRKYTASRLNLLPLKEQIIQGYLSGLTVRVLSDLYTTSPGNIRNFLISNGVTLRPTGRRKKVKP